jgi:conserved hypothetical protein
LPIPDFGSRHSAPAWAMNFLKLSKQSSRIKGGFMRIFVDMDGTLARFHDEVGYLERMFEKGFFSGLQPFQQAVQAINDLARYSKDCELFILSATVDGEPPYCCDEKNQWLDRYCPEIDQAHRLFTKIGISKSEYIPGGIQSDDILWDDYNKNLEEWVANGGVAVKCKNNINHKGLIGPIWQGLIIANDASSELIRNSLSEIAYEAAESSDEEWEL